MAFNLSEDILNYLEQSHEDCVTLIRELCAIPAPSHFEDARAEYVKNWLTNAGAEGVYIDEAKNVILEIKGENDSDAVVFMAHTDTVFPMETPLTWREDEKNYYCPAVGDDTTNLAVMLTVIRYIIKKGYTPKNTVLFVANACEEGLGNLKGSKQIVKDFGNVLREFYTLDGKYHGLATTCVGSHRYSITCESEGGHSFGAFGNTNAIAELAKLVTELYKVEVPKREGTKTTYNVGVIEGGTSVNTIAQNAKMLYEYRSDNRECLAEMKATFEAILERVKSESKATFSVEVVGMRPCDGDIDRALHRKMIDRVAGICEKYSGHPCVERSGSTDCNSASAAGIPDDAIT